MSCGGSVGEGYGPMIVSPRPFTPSEIKKKRIAVPGTLTTAYLALHLFAPGVETEVVPFDQIIPQVLEGKYEAGLIIHEGQLTYDKSGLHRIVDLGQVVAEGDGTAVAAGRQCDPAGPGPGVDAAVLRRRCARAFSTGSTTAKKRCRMPCSSPAILIRRSADKFIGMYVNERTLDYGEDGREAVRRLLDMGHKAGIIGPEARVDWV